MIILADLPATVKSFQLSTLGLKGLAREFSFSTADVAKPLGLCDACTMKHFRVWIKALNLYFDRDPRHTNVSLQRLRRGTGLYPREEIGSIRPTFRRAALMPLNPRYRVSSIDRGEAHLRWLNGATWKQGFPH